MKTLQPPVSSEWLKAPRRGMRFKCPARAHKLPDPKTKALYWRMERRVLTRMGGATRGELERDPERSKLHTTVCCRGLESSAHMLRAPPWQIQLGQRNKTNVYMFLLVSHCKPAGPVSITRLWEVFTCKLILCSSVFIFFTAHFEYGMVCTQTTVNQFQHL